MHFKNTIETQLGDTLKAYDIKILQVSLGYRCNLACKHCHVSAGPNRKEVMQKSTIDAVLDALQDEHIETLDITGGAPELNPHFESLVQQAAARGKHIIIRTNLSIFYENGFNNLPDFFRRNKAEIIASLPYYMEENVDRVRGSGTFRKSIDGLKLLNNLGYGIDTTGLQLNLVYNPQGAFLPPQQETLETEYKRELLQRFGISFNRLYTFTNMPIGRFKEYLTRTGNLNQYMDKLKTALNPDTLDGIMCRHLVSVGWDGTLYDCDFNQMIGLRLLDGNPHTIHKFNYEKLSARQIALDNHCYGCTAGQGST